MAAPRVTITSQTHVARTVTVNGIVTGKPTSVTVNLPAAATPEGAITRPVGTATVNEITGEFTCEFLLCPPGNYAAATVTATNADGTHSANTWPFKLWVAGTQPIGTPVVLLPTYVAPEFNTPAVPLNGKVTDFIIESTSTTDQTNIPFTMGQVFKEGDIAPSNFLVGKASTGETVDLQFNVKNTWPDGSVRFAVISGKIDLTVGQSKTIDIIRSASSAYNTLGQNSALINGFNITARATEAGVVYTANPKPLLDSNGPFHNHWLKGSFCNDYVINVPFKNAEGVEHPFLTAQFSVRAFDRIPRIKIDVSFEHIKAHIARTEITYDAEILRGTAVEYSKLALVHRPGARFKKTVYLGTPPAIFIKRNTRYWLDSKMFPNWDMTIPVPEKELNDWGIVNIPQFEPMKHGHLYQGMSTTGGRGDIGLVPMFAAAAILTNDKRAVESTLMHADIAAGAWGTHQRDIQGVVSKGRPLTIIYYPRAGYLGTDNDCKNAATGMVEKIKNSTYGADTSHQASMAYTPFLMTGDFYYLEEQLFWCNYSLMNSNPGYRSSFKALVHRDQLRGQAWSLRTMGQTFAVCPDDYPDKAAYKYYLDSNLSYYNKLYTDNPDANKLGLIDNDLVYAVGYDSAGVAIKRNAQAPFQEDHFTTTTGHLSELGFPEARRLCAWKAKFAMGRMISEGFCYVQAVTYKLRVREDEFSPMYTTFAQVYEATFRHQPDYLALPCLSQEQLDWMNANRDLPSNAYVLYQIPGDTTTYQPALAFSTDFGRMPNRDLAWSTFNNRPKKPTYGFGPQHWVLPRTDGKAVDDYVPPPPPPPPARGTLKTTYCDGTTKMGTYHDGAGGTYDEVIELKSKDCGYEEPPVETNPAPVDNYSTLSGTILYIGLDQ